MMRVLVADDDPGVREALCAVFEDDPEFTVVGVAATGPDAVAVTVQERPDIVLLDVRMPGGGLEAAQAIQAAAVRTTVIAISAKVDAVLVAAMLHAGARGVFVKGRLGRSLNDLVTRCHAGEIVLATPAAREGLRLFAGQAH